MGEKKYTTTEKNWLHRTEHGLGLGSEFMDGEKTMVITKVGEPYQDGRRRLIDTWAIEKQSEVPGDVSVTVEQSPGKRGRFREYIQREQGKEK